MVTPLVTALHLISVIVAPQAGVMSHYMTPKVLP